MAKYTSSVEFECKGQIVNISDFNITYLNDNISVRHSAKISWRIGNNGLTGNTLDSGFAKIRHTAQTDSLSGGWGIDFLESWAENWIILGCAILAAAIKQRAITAHKLGLKE